jgi:FkbM family methyltransferase
VSKTLLRELKRLFPKFYKFYLVCLNIRRSFSIYREGTFLGFKFIGMSSMHAGNFEKEESNLFLSLIGSFDLFIDVGANTGYYTAIALSWNVRTIAIEPLSQNLKILMKNIKLNGWVDVEIIPLGLGSSVSSIDMFGSDTGASFVKKWAGNTELFRKTISLTTLDTIIGNRFFEKKILVKIDVEGYEYQVLKGATSFLASIPRPALLVEICFTENFPGGINPNFKNTFELFWNLGYKTFTADTEMLEVTLTDVIRWMKSGERDFGGINYLVY